MRNFVLSISTTVELFIQIDSVLSGIQFTLYQNSFRESCVIDTEMLRNIEA